jgi:DNA-binding response OmpR family regulator
MAMMRPPNTLLVVDPASGCVPAIERALGDGWSVLHTATGGDALMALEAAQPDVLMIEAHLPDLPGALLVHDMVKRRRFYAPIILYGQTFDRVERVAAFRQGADAVLDKPIDIDELAARIEALFRSSIALPVALQDRRSRSVRYGRLSVDQHTWEVRLDGQFLHMSPVEAGLLLGLLKAAPEEVPYERLVRAGWPDTTTVYPNDINALTTQISKLRARLGAAKCDLQVLNRKGIGYYLVLE